MSLLDSHTATFSRYVESGKDDLGNFTGTSQHDGFPVDVVGQFAQSSGRSSRETEGLRSKRDAVFRSRTFFAGKSGDFVTFRGVSYLVIEVIDNRHAVGYQHFMYGLVRSEIGNSQKFSEVDDMEIN